VLYRPPVRRFAGFYTGARECGRMSVLLQETVVPELVNGAGWVVLLGGILLTALWLRTLYR
jgi:hypothetical protein